MARGIGGKTQDQALAELSSMASDIDPIPAHEFQTRLRQLQDQLKSSGAAAAYLHAGTNLYYFTGLNWHPSERMVAALVPAEGDVQYIAPRFEVDTLRDHWLMEAPIHAWEEHESPYQLVRRVLEDLPGRTNQVLVDEVTPFFTFDGLRLACPRLEWRSAQSVTQACRSRKSPAELKILQRAHEMTMEVQRAAASILRPGISTDEVTAFIDAAHRTVGAPGGSSFCIVLFGVATSFPHGVKEPQVLQENDWVLVDTGCLLHGYNSDITRSYAFGEPTEMQRTAWNHEQQAQLAGFAAAALGRPCEIAIVRRGPIWSPAAMARIMKSPACPTAPVTAAAWIFTSLRTSSAAKPWRWKLAWYSAANPCWCCPANSAFAWKTIFSWANKVQSGSLNQRPALMIRCRDTYLKVKTESKLGLAQYAA